MQSNVEAGKNLKVFVFDCRKMNRADFTAAKVALMCYRVEVFSILDFFAVYRSVDIGFEKGGKNGYILWVGEKRC